MAARHSKAWCPIARRRRCFECSMQPLLPLLLLMSLIHLNLFGRTSSLPIPLVGYGTAHIKDEKTILEALEVGYRLIDTGVLYENQDAVGKALKQTSTPREQIYVATKVGFYPPSMLNNFFHWLDRLGMLPGKLKFVYMAAKGFEVEGLAWSLEQLQLDHIDACMVHTPATSWTEFLLALYPHRFGRFQPVKNWPMWLGEWMEWILRGLDSLFGASEEAKKERHSWEVLEDAYGKGLCRNIGVSNYDLALLTELETYARRPISVLEIKSIHDTYLPKRSAIAKRKGYTSSVMAMASAWRKPMSQVTLRWAVEHNITVIPRTSKIARMRENLEILNFELGEQALNKLNSLGQESPFYWDVSKLTTATSQDRSGDRNPEL
eukprot:CAMPEP_0206611130 /NCGR_PEP_ID=MMETSP0325_2-20121206/55048_1 /ASSEMBLY_ACC=CAM_ASM_000347 /TAXON_ID=2866 /ORGANISM="Crypthecodinium cohnii, Strain Seligo" /LENGTH=377 /DNA_ID=CAMNT_0054130247 /DNA_START=50 /DNA_END=1185 /DNA_ORIENTATION=-